MTDERESESGGLGTMRSFEEYRARVFPNETDRRRFDSNDPSTLGKAVADRVIERTRARPSLVRGRRGSLARS